MAGKAAAAIGPDHAASATGAFPLASRPNSAAIAIFWIRTITGGLGPIHLFSVLVLVQVPRAIWFARRGQIDRHMTTMRGIYFGLIAAGLIAMAPGRMLSALLFG
ncbi:hypothetical protein ATE71_11755 [Sphingopyxis sp. H115]|nr:hypothetical protein ATE71_11755 [Sphingopyxis sp. H115]